MAPEIDALAAFVAATQWEDVPSSVQHHTKLVLLDTLGVIRPAMQRALDSLKTVPTDIDPVNESNE